MALGKAFISKASWAGLTASALLFAGATGIGLGTGEFIARDDSPTKSMNNWELRDMLKTNSSGPEGIESVLEYAKVRDGDSSSVDTMLAILEHAKSSSTSFPAEGPHDEYVSRNDYVTRSENDRLDMYIDIMKQLADSDKEHIKPEKLEPTNSESIMTEPMAFWSICMGIASAVIALCVRP